MFYYIATVYAFFLHSYGLRFRVKFIIPSGEMLFHVQHLEKEKEKEERPPPTPATGAFTTTRSLLPSIHAGTHSPQSAYK